jgi:hypothetical protein
MKCRQWLPAIAAFALLAGTARPNDVYRLDLTDNTKAAVKTLDLKGGLTGDVDVTPVSWRGGGWGRGWGGGWGRGWGGWGSGRGWGWGGWGRGWYGAGWYGRGWYGRGWYGGYGYPGWYGYGYSYPAYCSYYPSYYYYPTVSSWCGGPVYYSSPLVYARPVISIGVPYANIQIQRRSAVVQAEPPLLDTLPAPTPLPGTPDNGTYRYDGDPKNRVPMPRTEPTPPAPAPGYQPGTDTGFNGNVAAYRVTPKYRYLAYGERPAAPASMVPTSSFARDR